MRKIIFKEESLSFYDYLILECKCSKKTAWETARIIDRLLDTFTTDHIRKGDVEDMSTQSLGYTPSGRYMNNAWRYSISKYREYKNDNG